MTREHRADGGTEDGAPGSSRPEPVDRLFDRLAGADQQQEGIISSAGSISERRLLMIPSCCWSAPARRSNSRSTGFGLELPGDPSSVPPSARCSRVIPVS